MKIPLLVCLLAACAWGQTEPIMSGSLTLIGNPVMCYTGPALDGCNIETLCDNGSESITAMACTPKHVLENWLGMPTPIAPHHAPPPLPEPTEPTQGMLELWEGKSTLVTGMLCVNGHGLVPCPVTPTVVPAIKRKVAGLVTLDDNGILRAVVGDACADPDDVLLTSESGRKWCLRVK